MHLLIIALASFFIAIGFIVMITGFITPVFVVYGLAPATGLFVALGGVALLVLERIALAVMHMAELMNAAYQEEWQGAETDGTAAAVSALATPESLPEPGGVSPQPKQAQSAQQPEQAQPTQQPKQVQPAQQPKQAQSVQQPEQAQPTQQPKQVQPAQQPKQAQPAQQPEQAQPAQQAKQAQPAQQSKQAQPAQQAKQTQAAQQSGQGQKEPQPEQEGPPAAHQKAGQEQHDSKTQQNVQQKAPAKSTTKAATADKVKEVPLKAAESSTAVGGTQHPEKENRTASAEKDAAGRERDGVESGAVKAAAQAAETGPAAGKDEGRAAFMTVDDEDAAPGDGNGTLYVVEETTIRGMPARVLSDGTIEAQLPEGWLRFENLDHLNEYMDALEELQKKGII